MARRSPGSEALPPPRRSPPTLRRTSPRNDSHAGTGGTSFLARKRSDYVNGAELRDVETVYGPGLARGLDRRLQHLGAAFGARDAEPGRVPSERDSLLLAA